MSRSRHLVDPGLLPLLDAFPTVLLTHDNLAEMRGRDLPFDVVDDGRVELLELSVGGGDGEAQIPMRLYRPRDIVRPIGCILHIHGGGYVAGSVAEVEFLHRPLSADLECAILTVDYRLAPETIFPGALEDCYRALSWLFGEADSLGIDTTRIGVMGESAGGGLAAALALLARDKGEYPLAFQHLIYPMLDDRTCVREPHPFTGDYIWPPSNNRFGWSALLGHEPGGEGVSPYAAAARADDLSNLPPTFIGTAALDLFVDENIDYAQRLIRAGVPTELHVWPGAFHGFDLVPGVAVSDAARAASVAALRRFLKGN